LESVWGINNVTEKQSVCGKIPGNLMHIKESFFLSFYNRDKKEKDMGGKKR